MAYIDFVSELHKSTKRDYIGRVTSDDKAECAKVAKEYGYDYWDGDRKYGYGGYRYDGRWRSVAQKLADHYNLKAGQKVLDVGCGMAHLLYELTQVVPGLDIYGIDISQYALEHAKEEIRDRLQYGQAQDIPFGNKEFDQADWLYRHLWVYSHGIATLCATRACAFAPEEIETMLTEIFLALHRKLQTEGIA